MPSTLWNPTDMQEIRDRIAALQADSQGLWGVMTVDKMMRHLSRAYQGAAGKVQMPDEGLMARLASLKPASWFMINVMPWPKGLPTAKGFTITDTAEFEAARQELLQAIDDFVEAGREDKLQSHPLFGQLNKKDWGVLMYKHTNHHLKQFGV